MHLLPSDRRHHIESIIADTRIPFRIRLRYYLTWARFELGLSKWHKIDRKLHGLEGEMTDLDWQIRIYRASSDNS